MNSHEQEMEKLMKNFNYPNDMLKIKVEPSPFN